VVVDSTPSSFTLQSERSTLDREATVVVVNGTVGEGVLMDDEEGAAPDPPHAVIVVAPTTTSNPMTCRRSTQPPPWPWYPNGQFPVPPKDPNAHQFPMR
jgi:hypothetical protein